MLESVKIIGICIAAGILYGVVHDQFTARICMEYFTVFHPPVFATQSPTLLAIGWGIIATWWVSAFLGILMAFAARAGTRPKLDTSSLIRPISYLLIVMAVCAALSGTVGYLLTEQGQIFPPSWVVLNLRQGMYSRFMADWCAHNASYASGFLGGVYLCFWVHRKRKLS